MRVLFSGYDLDGMRLENLTKMGYEIQNEQILAMEGYEMKIRLFHIRYGILICVACFVALYTPGKATVDKVVLFIVAHWVAERHRDNAPAMALEFLNDGVSEIDIIDGVIGAEGGRVIVKYYCLLAIDRKSVV